MKKLLIFIASLLSMLVVISSEVFAEELPVNYTNYVSRFDTWELISLSGFYFVRSNAVLIEHDYLEVEILTDTACLISSPSWICELEGGQVFRESTQSRLVINNTGIVGTSIAVYPLKYEAPEATEILFPYGDDDFVDKLEHKLKYIRIDIALIEGLTINNYNMIVSRLNNDIELFFPGWTIRAYNDVGATETSIEALPFTTGNPFTEGGHFGKVDFLYNNGTNTFYMDLEYFGNYQVELSGLVFSSTDFLENVENAYYYTIGTERFIIFYYQEDMELLLTEIDVLTKQWSGFAIWNMTTGEVVTTNRAWVLTYFYRDVNDPNMDIYAYFYMPNIPVDDLLSVSLVMHYRYYYHSFPFEWGTQKVEQVWSKTAMTLQKGVSQLGGLPTWVKEVYTGSGVALAAGTILSIIPGTQPIGLALLLTGGILMSFATFGALDYIISGGIDEIVYVAQPTQTMRNNIEAHYSLLAGTSITVNPGDPLYRLYLGRYNKTNPTFYPNDVEICYNSNTQACDEYQEFKYTEIVWVTDGEIYSIHEPYIDSQSTMDQSWFIGLPEPGPTLGSRYANLIKVAAIPALTIIWALVAYRGGGFDKIGKLILFLIGYAVLLGGILFAISGL